MKNSFGHLFSREKVTESGERNAGSKFVYFFMISSLVGLFIFTLFSREAPRPLEQESANITVTPTKNIIQSTPTDIPTRITNTPSNKPTRIPSATPYLPSTTSPHSNSTALISCTDVENVNLRKSPGYINKDDNKDVVREIRCGEYVQLSGESKYADDLNWWKVTWMGDEGWIADHTGHGKEILVFLHSFSPDEPAEFIYWYLNSLWQERNYSVLWDVYLTPRFQNHSSPGGIEEYIGWWDSVKQIDIHSIEVLQNNGRIASIRIDITLHLFDGRILRNRSFEYDIVYDPETKIWLFDYRN